MIIKQLSHWDPNRHIQVQKVTVFSEASLRIRIRFKAFSNRLKDKFQSVIFILAMANRPMEGEPTNSICRVLKMFVILKLKNRFLLQRYAALKSKVLKPPNGP